MSKYIDELTELICDTVRTVFPNASLDDGYDVADEVIAKLPTIELSEDCISKHDIWKIIEDNAYWVRYNENSTEKGMTLTGINQALNECPLVAPTVSEDCISREHLLSKVYDMDNDNLVVDLKDIEDAPSVVPSRAEGEWQITDAYPHNVYCSECHKKFAQTHWNIWEDGSLPRNYCPNCGAKMKGADDE